MTRLAEITVYSVLLIACSGGTTDSTPTAPTPPGGDSSPPAASATCFSFSPVSAQASSSAQRVTVQVVASSSSCSWTATTSERWITVVRSGSLYQAGSGPLTFDVDQNQDERFGGCPTTPRTGLITVAEEGSGAEALLEVHQDASVGPYQPQPACVVAPLPYGATVNGSLVASDCKKAFGSEEAPVKYYTFQGFADQRINISMFGGRYVSGGLPLPLFRLYGPGGGYVVGAGGNVVVDDPNVSRRLFCDGTFTLEVSSDISSTFNPTGLGNYTLRLSSQN